MKNRGTSTIWSVQIVEISIELPMGETQELFECKSHSFKRGFAALTLTLNFSVSEALITPSKPCVWSALELSMKTITIIKTPARRLLKAQGFSIIRGSAANGKRHRFLFFSETLYYHFCISRSCTVLVMGTSSRRPVTFLFFRSLTSFSSLPSS